VKRRDYTKRMVSYREDFDIAMFLLALEPKERTAWLRTATREHYNKEVKQYRSGVLDRIASLEIPMVTVKRGVL